MTDPASSASHDGPAPHEEVEQLKSRLAALEAEKNEYARQIEELFVLQQVFSTINSSLEINDILSTVLRGVRAALKFGRVILFDVLADGAILRRLECDADGNVARSEDERSYRADSTLREVASGAIPLSTGSPADPDAPLTDGRGAYCVVPIVTRDVVRGLLYADDLPTAEIDDGHMRMLLDFAAQAAMAMENARLYDETRRLLEETQRLALTDTLTGIANRRALHQLFEHELRTAERYQTPLAFIILDLDDLKAINDSGGHSLGDLALQRFSQVLLANARRGDIVARYAGDEFVIVMTHSERRAAARGVERVLSALRRHGLPASIGIAMFPDDGRDAQSLFFAADEALYDAKIAGKNRYRFYRNPEAALLDVAQ
ncbi:MAG TPA: sensor domain-containing diguanylate cyclase [Candidatus Dormibacteraeota bacterium]|nr:sensor domain-containing diguanylate cyclase [Candidatus Dormibacteraeota bacterium]